MMREIKHLVQCPSGIRTIIGMIAIISIESMNVVRLWGRLEVFYMYASLTLVIMGLVVLWISLYRTFIKKPTELCLSNEQITLNGKVIDSKDIKMIMTRGYFKPAIGILPHKRRIVPSDMAFSYSKDEDTGISDLKSWAEMNNVKMVNKWFQTWI